MTGATVRRLAAILLGLALIGLSGGEKRVGAAEPI
jgi:hypothetical protein